MNHVPNKQNEPDGDATENNATEIKKNTQPKQEQKFGITKKNMITGKDKIKNLTETNEIKFNFLSKFCYKNIFNEINFKLT